MEKCNEHISLQSNLNWSVEELEKTYFKNDRDTTLGEQERNKDKPANIRKLFLGNTNLQLTKATNVWTCERTAALLGLTLILRKMLWASVGTQDVLQITETSFLTDAEWLQNQGESVTNTRKWTDMVWWKLLFTFFRLALAWNKWSSQVGGTFTYEESKITTLIEQEITDSKR